MKFRLSPVGAAALAVAGSVVLVGGPLAVLPLLGVPRGGPAGLAAVAWALIFPWLAWGVGGAISNRGRRR